MVKKVRTGLFVCMFVFAFSFVPIAVSEEYSGTAKMKGNWMGLDEEKGNIQEKCTIGMKINDRDGNVQGKMVCDETTFWLYGMLGDQAFALNAKTKILGEEHASLIILGKVKEKKGGQIKLEGIFAGIDSNGEVLQGKINAELATGESMPED